MADYAFGSIRPTSYGHGDRANGRNRIRIQFEHAQCIARPDVALAPRSKINGFWMSDTRAIPVKASHASKRSFAAMRHPGFRAQFITFVLAMMADNIEHVISYWMVYQKFH